VNPKIKAQMENMEQSTARQIGDRSGRARMNADGTLKATYRPNCNLIITAEESFSNVGESAIARSISVELKPGDVDLTALTEVQQKADHFGERRYKHDVSYFLPTIGIRSRERTLSRTYINHTIQKTQ